MTKKMWKTRITRCTKDAGTYKPYFDDVIETLADILSNRDGIQDAFDESGEAMFSGNVLHPALKMVGDLNREALQYWRELGLTPSSLRKMNDSVFKPKEQSGFSVALVEALNGTGA